MAAHGGDVDDASSIAGEVSERELAAEGDGHDVDAPHFLPIGRVAIVDVREVSDARTIHESIDATEVLEGGMDVLLFLQIGMDRRDSGGEGIGSSGDPEDRGSACNQDFAESAADTTGSTGDENDGCIRFLHVMTFAGGY